MQSSVAPLTTLTDVPVPASELDEEPGEAGRDGTHEPPHDEETPDPEDRLITKLMIKLTELGLVTARPTTTAEPLVEPSEAESSPDRPSHETRDENSRWGRGWTGWSESWSSPEEWKPDTITDWNTRDTGDENKSGNWKDYRWKSDGPKTDRPYISHLFFPKFDGRREDFPEYQYAALNLKSQCTPQDYKYLAPKLIACFTGAMRDDAKAMDLNATEFQVSDGVERLLKLIRKRLHITDLSLETEAFDRYFAQLARKKRGDPHEVHKCRGNRLQKTSANPENGNRAWRGRVQRRRARTRQIEDHNISTSEEAAWLALSGTCRHTTQGAQWDSEPDRRHEHRQVETGHV